MRLSTPRLGKGRGSKLRLVHAGTSWLAVDWFMRGQLSYLRRAGFDVTVISSPGPGLDEARLLQHANTIPLPIMREIRPLRDLLSLYRFWRAVRDLRPDVVNVGTPKAGLLGGIAAWLNRVPCRFYTLHGLRHETTGGLKGAVLWLCERIACACAHRVICVSESLRERAVAIGIVERSRTVVLGSGSCNGVDVRRFAPSEILLRRAALIRSQWGIPPDSPVLGFVGRLTRDKGIPELVEAYERLQADVSDLRLLLVGDYESGDPIHSGLRRKIETAPHIHRSGFVKEIEVYYHVMDVLVLPTYREGFGNAILEAHAAGKPVVGTRATGVVDAVIDGVTGILVPIGDSVALADACARILRDPDLANAMGRAGCERVLREFQQEMVWEALLREYRAILNERGVGFARVRVGKVAGHQKRSPNPLEISQK